MTRTKREKKKAHIFLGACLHGSINAVSVKFRIFNVFILAMPQVQRNTNMLIHKQ